MLLTLEVGSIDKGGKEGPTMNPDMFSLSQQPADNSEDFEFNYAVPAPSPAPMMAMSQLQQQASSVNNVVMASGNYATNDEFNDLEDKLCELMIDEDTLDHSPLASVQEIDAAEESDEQSFKAKNSSNSSSQARPFRIDDEQIIDDKQLLEHQENDQSFLINDNLIKLFRIYQQIVARKRAERALHHGKRFQHNSSFDYDASSSGGNNDAELMDQDMSDTIGSDYHQEEAGTAAEEDSRVKINEVKSMLMTSSSSGAHETITTTAVHDEESAHNAFFNGTLSEADLLV